MGRLVENQDDEQLLRTMLSSGVTEDLQMSVSLPIPIATTGHMPSGRMMAMMSGRRELEAFVGWRFHRQPVGVGGRFESTAYFGGTVPLQDEVAGMRTTPSAVVSFATGYAGRAHYFWAGAGYQRYGAGSGDRLGDVAFYSVVYGHRPAPLRFDYPKPDVRFFVEAVGETTKPAHHATAPGPGDPHHDPSAGGSHGGVIPPNGGTVVLVGPTVLLLYKAYGVEGGLLFPVYQRLRGVQPEERFRFGLNISYFFWAN